MLYQPARCLVGCLMLNLSLQSDRLPCPLMEGELFHDLLQPQFCTVCAILNGIALYDVQTYSFYMMQYHSKLLRGRDDLALGCHGQFLTPFQGVLLKGFLLSAFRNRMVSCIYAMVFRGDRV